MPETAILCIPHRFLCEESVYNCNLLLSVRRRLLPILRRFYHRFITVFLQPLQVFLAVIPGIGYHMLRFQTEAGVHVLQEWDEGPCIGWVGKYPYPYNILAFYRQLHVVGRLQLSVLHTMPWIKQATLLSNTVRMTRPSWKRRKVNMDFSGPVLRAGRFTGTNWENRNSPGPDKYSDSILRL